MVVTLYLATFLASFLVLILLLLTHQRVISTAVLFSILTTIQGFGRYLIAVSNTYEMARLGNLMVYVGGCFCPFMVMLILVKLCDMNMPLWLQSSLFVYSSVIFMLVLTIGHSPVYYKNMSLMRADEGYTYIVKEYGPAHILYPVLMLIYFFIVAFCMIYAISKYKEVSLRTISPIVALAVIIMVAYAVERVAKTHISYLSVGYLLAMLLFLHLINHVNMFDLASNIANCIEKNQENAYLEFDTRMRCAGYNDRFAELFPEVEEKWNVDDPIPQDNSFVYKEVIQWVYNRKQTDKKTIQLNGRYYEMFVHEIPYGTKSCVGYLLEMIDRTSENKYIAAMEHYNENLESDVEWQTAHINHIKDMMVLGMSAMVESRDNSTGGHIKRTSKVMEVFAGHLMRHLSRFDMSEDFLKMVVRAAPMHDLGKIAVDDAILRKQGRFTDEEYEKMKMHSAEGARILHGILTGVEDENFVHVAENVAHYHHEKWNGKGYPCGLSGTDIPKEARMMALADVFDALVSKRCYKEAFSYDKAFSIIENDLGSHFDPELGKIFLECRPELERLYNRWNAEDQPAS